MRPASVSVVLPTRRGGELLRRVVDAIRGQESVLPIEVVIVDSGSPAAELGTLRSLGATVIEIAPEEFDHGATRDLGAERSVGDVLVFLNQDALPIGELWLSRLLEPFLGADPPAAVQGGIVEFPPGALDGVRRFFWDSCGPRFYFTSESESWIARHGGLGFSTVNCALARSAWQELRLGPMPILEDKRWQKGAAERGWRIESRSDAQVWHSHDYDLASLWARCASEGFGWRLVGERYSLRSGIGDLTSRFDWREWRRGIRSGECVRPAEILFPLIRPLALWWGNRRGRHPEGGR